jgi:hypothetical protein
MREGGIPDDENTVNVPASSRINPVPRIVISSDGCVLFDERRLVGETLVLRSRMNRFTNKSAPTRAAQIPLERGLPAKRPAHPPASLNSPARYAIPLQ